MHLFSKSNYEQDIIITCRHAMFHTKRIHGIKFQLIIDMVIMAAYQVITANTRAHTHTHIHARVSGLTVTI